jgi:hypothetical protein
MSAHKNMRAVLVLFFLLLAHPSPRADGNELRLGVSASTGVLTVVAFSTTDSVAAFGGAATVSWGVFDALEIGGRIGYLTRTDASLKGAKIGHIGGDGFRLFADIHDIELTGSANIVFGRWLSPALVRWHPYIGARAGAAVRVIASPQLYNPDDRGTGTQSSETALFPTVGFDLGTAYRLSDHFQIGFGLHGSYSGGDRSFVGTSFEIAWMTL